MHDLSGPSSNRKTPTVSVIIPVHNRPDELRRALESIRSQTLADWEAIVVDDASSADIEKVCRSFDDLRIRSHRLTEKRNANVARNAGLDIARGRYAAMLDSDDEWLPRHLENRIRTIETIGCDGVFGSFYCDDGQKRRLFISRPFHPGESMADYLLSNGRATASTHVYRTECAREIGWDEALIRTQDTDFCIRFAERFAFCILSDATCIQHQPRGRLVPVDAASQRRFIEKHRERIKPFFVVNYHRRACRRLKEAGIGGDDLKYFQDQAAKGYDIKEVSFAEYLSVAPRGESRLARLYHRIVFILKVLFG